MMVTMTLWHLNNSIECRWELNYYVRFIFKELQIGERQPERHIQPRPSEEKTWLLANTSITTRQKLYSRRTVYRVRDNFSLQMMRCQS